MAAGNRLQASEKVWGTVTHALKAVAARRGWRHTSHTHLRDVANQLGLEKGLAVEYNRHMDKASSMHANFYENEADWDLIDIARKDADAFVAKLRSDLNRPPRPFTIRDANDQRRLGRLLGLSVPRDPVRAQQMLDRELPSGTRSPQGFAPKYGYRPPQNRPRAPRRNPNAGLKKVWHGLAP